MTVCLFLPSFVSYADHQCSDCYTGIFWTVSGHACESATFMSTFHAYRLSISRTVNTASSYLQFNLRVGIIGVAYLVGMSTYTLGAIVVGLLSDKLVSE